MLIDTPAWIEFFRAKGDAILKSKVSRLVSQGGAAYTCPVSFELILGAKPHEMQDLQTALSMALRLKATSGRLGYGCPSGGGSSSERHEFPCA